MRTTTVLKSATVQVADPHDAEVLRTEGARPMFRFSDPNGDGLVYLEEAAPRKGRA